MVVLIDDYHRLRGPAVGEVLARLIDGLNGRVSFVIASRERPACFESRSATGVARLELSGDELRFAADEARELLSRGTRTIADEVIDVIVASADGWVIALTAARDWLADGWSVDRVSESLARPAAHLSRYVTDQVLHSLSAPEREFLQRTAIVDRYNEDLAATLADKLAIRDIIAALERKDLLVLVWEVTSDGSAVTACSPKWPQRSSSAGKPSRPGGEGAAPSACADRGVHRAIARPACARAGRRSGGRVGRRSEPGHARRLPASLP